MRIYGETRFLFFIVKKMKTLPILLKTKPLNMKKETNAEHIYFDSNYLEETGRLKIAGFFLLR